MEWSLKTIIKSIEENEKDEKEIESGLSYKLKVWEGLKLPWSTNLKLNIDPRLTFTKNIKGFKRFQFTLEHTQEKYERKWKWMKKWLDELRRGWKINECKWKGNGWKV